MNAARGTPSRSSLLRANPPTPRWATDRGENQPASKNSGPSPNMAPATAGKDSTVDHSTEAVRSS